MVLKLIFLFVVGATLAYAGVLTLAGNFPVGIGMLIAGAWIAALPIWRVYRRYGQPPAWPSGPSGRRGRNKKKVHLKIVNDDNEEHRTYH